MSDTQKIDFNNCNSNFIIPDETHVYINSVKGIMTKVALEQFVRAKIKVVPQTKTFVDNNCVL